MNQTKTVSKRLCMNELLVSHTELDPGRHYAANAGESHAAFLLPISGRIELSAMGKSVSAEPGKLVYLPEGIRYRAIFEGGFGIEYYGLHIVTAKGEYRPTDRPYSLQSFDAPAGASETAAEIFRLLAGDDRIGKLRAVSLYYGLYAELLPCLESEGEAATHDALTRAMRYIEEHYAESFDVSVIAAAACISTSRLFHLFHDVLKTTPIAYRNEVRIERASRALRTADRSVEEIAADSGFHSAAYFRETFRRETGQSPSEYRRRAKKGER